MKPEVPQLREQILRLLADPKYRPLDKVELGKALGRKSGVRMNLNAVLREMERDGQVARIRKNRYVLPAEADLVRRRVEDAELFQRPHWPANVQATSFKLRVLWAYRNDPSGFQLTDSEIAVLERAAAGEEVGHAARPQVDHLQEGTAALRNPHASVTALRQ